MVKRDDQETRAIIQQVREHYGGKVFDTETRDDPSLEEAPTRGKSIFEYAPDSQGAKEYLSVVDEVIDRMDRYGSVYGTVREKQSDRT